MLSNGIVLDPYNKNSISLGPYRRWSEREEIGKAIPRRRLEFFAEMDYAWNRRENAARRDGCEDTCTRKSGILGMICR
jgi:hypothetical protein